MSIVISIIALIVSIIAAGAATHLAYQSKLSAHWQPKRDVLRRYVGNLHRLNENPDGSEPFIALNEARAVFGEDKEVVRILRELSGDNQSEKHVKLVRAMAKASGFDMSALSDDFIMRPFKPSPPPP